ncbi:hypothetical protein X797_010424 [Metarhizium robertsii]|uniref:Uncharacterized protein n=2 Tax=Metarhizium robertsii TaxID=568076 RepID=A0A0B2XH61_METRA|nr:uncharacterized protein MAA_11051 [Metarhizium robertsii ARSEF 23]EXU96462.1 hypothetical protein X797_010424 [Metarhizium robertsii]KHO11236.1 hypothetical protein MAA_11051 [Metarhizium robertsii ARSEF 23]
MLALSLLLCAAGVKAMLGFKIEAIKISDKQAFCSDNCAFEGAYFLNDGRVCAVKELVVQLNTAGLESPEPYKYTCAEAALTKGDRSTRPRKNGEEPRKCLLEDIDESSGLPGGIQCALDRFAGDGVELRLVEQLSEVKKLLGLPASQEAQGCKEATDGATQNEPREVSF